MAQKPVIFLVEDDQSILTFEEEILIKEGYRVLKSENFEQAMLGILTHKDEIDLLVLDIKLDQDSEAGLKLAQFLRTSADLSRFDQAKQKLYPNFQANILVTTGDNSLQLAQAFEDLNIIGCLLKMFSADDFLEAVRASLILDPADLVSPTGERVLYEWGSKARSDSQAVMHRQMIIRPDGTIFKTGTWTRGGILSICLPVVIGYCPIGCRFCSHAYTEKEIQRAMTSEEIINSVRTALKGGVLSPALEKDEKFDIAFTGEGEPGRNLHNTIEAIHQLSKEYKDQLRRIVVSTTKTVVIKRLLREEFSVPVQLQISGTFLEEDRRKYMPGAASLKELLEFGFEYWQKTHKALPVIINHVLIAGQTDTDQKIKQLTRIIKQVSKEDFSWLNVKISNYNPIKNIDWKESGGRAMQIKKLFAENEIPSFFYRIPRRQIEGMPDK